MDIIDEYSDEIVEVYHFHQENENIVSLLCNKFGQIYIYNEREFLTTKLLSRNIFPLVAAIYKDTNLMLDENKAFLQTFTAISKVFIIDKQNIFVTSNQKLFKLASNFYQKNINKRMCEYIC